MNSRSPDALTIDAGRVRRSFERAAASYDGAALLQREIGARMLERLDYVKLAPRTILDAGTGTGNALAALAQRYPKADLIALDIAQAMLRRARGDSRWLARLLRRGPRTAFVCADAQRLPFAPSVLDFICSNLTMQWCGDLPR